MRSLFLALAFILPIGSSRAEAQLNSAADFIENEYSHLIYQRYGKRLEVTSQSSCSSGACFKEGPQRVLVVLDLSHYIFKSLDKASLISILCHEIGHGLAGGRTFKKLETESLPPSIEGEADFFSAQCLKNAFAKGFLDHRDLTIVDDDVKKICHANAECEVVLQSPKNVFRIFYKSDKPSYTKNEYPRLFSKDDHPSHQCRLDTIRLSYLENKKAKCWNGIKD